MTPKEWGKFVFDVATFPVTPKGVITSAVAKSLKELNRIVKGFEEIAVTSNVAQQTAKTATKNYVPKTVPTSGIKRKAGNISGEGTKKFAPRQARDRLGEAAQFKCGLNTHASTPVGRKGQQFHVLDKANIPTIINGREYSGHVLDRMQQRGITPSIVENTIRNGVISQAKNTKRLIHFDLANNISVVTEEGNVITTCWGKFK